VMTQYLSPRLSLLLFTAVLTLGVALVTPRLLIGGSEPATSQPPLSPGRRAPTGRIRSHALRLTRPSNRSPR